MRFGDAHTLQAAVMHMMQEDLAKLYADMDRNLGERTQAAADENRAELQRQRAELSALQRRVDDRVAQMEQVTDLVAQSQGMITQHVAGTRQLHERVQAALASIATARPSMDGTRRSGGPTPSPLPVLSTPPPVLMASSLSASRPRPVPAPTSSTPAAAAAAAAAQAAAARRPVVAGQRPVPPIPGFAAATWGGDVHGMFKQASASPAAIRSAAAARRARTAPSAPSAPALPKQLQAAVTRGARRGAAAKPKRKASSRKARTGGTSRGASARGRSSKR